MRKLLLSFAFVATFAAPSYAAHLSDFYVIPVAIRAPGAFGTSWVTDVSIHNFGNSSLTVEFLFIETGEGASQNMFNLESTAMPSGSVTLAPGTTRIVRDVMNGFQGRSQGLVGGLALSGNVPFAVTSRTFTAGPGGGSFGQTVPPVQGFIDNTIGGTDVSMAVAYLPGVVTNGSFRTNIGFLAASGDAGMTITAELRLADGTSGGTRTFNVPANRFVHIQFGAATIGTVTTFDAASVRMRITAGSGAVTPYASIVDNVSGDAVYVAGNFPPTTSVFKRGIEESHFRRLLLQTMGR